MDDARVNQQTTPQAYHPARRRHQNCSLGSVRNQVNTSFHDVRSQERTMYLTQNLLSKRFLETNQYYFGKNSLI